MHGRGKLERAVAHAFEILHQEIEWLEQAEAERMATPLLLALRSHFESERLAALAESGGDVDMATRRLVNRLLHRPSATLRDLAARGDNAAVGALLRRLFGLEDGSEK
jgi:glutamyl-tRNA reductase